MQKRKVPVEFEEYAGIDELAKDDAGLLRIAIEATKNAFADFSNFKVGAAARVKGETEIYTGSNQENASYPVGICAERALLAAVASKFGTKKVIETIAISYDNGSNKKSVEPLSPCGMCRQALVQYEDNADHPIRLILSGNDTNGKIYILKNAKTLLPLAFTGEGLQ